MRHPTVTRTELPNGKFRYFVDDEVLLKASGKRYEFASVYRHVTLSDWDIKCGRKVGDPVVFLHTRIDLAAKGNNDANAIARHGSWKREPGVVVIEDR